MTIALPHTEIAVTTHSVTWKPAGFRAIRTLRVALEWAHDHDLIRQAIEARYAIHRDCVEILHIEGSMS